ncbi:class I SAM-dependent methyltransferase [Robertkochia marina]|uniref:Class I SAM-dependent methyltransferase n=1 Tax=Robertkochia marina TaxID=1227945 RepID=A0A4S3LY51_9FLAO|nr:class I SAM-dependent methyltransferase [Robertkochia marina]THD66510.1 class I SAM-dependent methyltransferase [Robertkochia marina]TRZ45651.1 class I SAM-dependent methyltransferase [Robertkochia marina]
MTKEIANWYKEWFDTDFYHILYRERNQKEAELFMKNLTTYLNLPEQANILDLGCGRGRHSVMLHQMGYKVKGFDLSENNIRFAKQFETENLTFEIQDMCKTYPGRYDAIFNLFTSFGYFEDDQKHLSTLCMIKEHLNETGFGVIDFMNVTQIKDHLVPEEKVLVNDILFHIKRYEEDGYILKDISFDHEGASYHFTEKVRALTLKDFEDMFEKAGIYLLDIFGDYKLNKYHPEQSDRLVMIFK